MKNKIQSYAPSLYSNRKSTLGANVKTFAEISSLKDKIVFIGIPDDRGVKNNGGYIGAANGPEAFRKNFYKLYDTSINHKYLSDSIADVGDICLAETISETHDRLTEVMQHIIQQNPSCVFVIGGGHDFSYASYRAHYKTFKSLIPIVNFDAHFDLRDLNDNGAINSGSSFLRIINEFPQAIAQGQALCEIGIQTDRNPHELFEFAKKSKIKSIACGDRDDNWRDYETGEQTSALNHVLDHLKTCSMLGWEAQKSSLHLSLDIDIFASNIAMGTSAATPFGAQISHVLPALFHFAQNSFCKIIDVAELCPNRDINEQTARFVAGLLYRMIEVRLQMLSTV